MRKESVAPIVMVAGSTGTIGEPLCAALEAMGCSVRRVSRKEYDLRSDAEIGIALLAAKPDIVIDATSHLGSGPAQVFRGMMTSSMNLIHACAAAGLRFVQLRAPAIAWPWEDLETIRTFVNVQDSVQILRDAYVQQHRLNSVSIQLPMVYAADARRSEALSVIIAHLCKAAKEKLEECRIPFHEGHIFSMVHASDAGRAVAELAVSDLVGNVNIPGPAPVTCGEIVSHVAEVVKFEGSVTFGAKQPEMEPEEWISQDAKLPINISMEQGVDELTKFMMGVPAAPPAPKPPRSSRKRRTPAGASKGK